jgi:hypothetical protein
MTWKEFWTYALVADAFALFFVFGYVLGRFLG